MATTVTERFQENDYSNVAYKSTTVTRSFLVHFDTQQGAASAIKASEAVSNSSFSVAVGDEFPGYTWLVCQSKTARCQDGDLLTWLVTCVYGIPEIDTNRKPSINKPVISYGSVSRQYVPPYYYGVGAIDAEPASLSISAKIVAKNSANDIYPDVPPSERINLLIRIDKRLSGSFSPTDLMSYVNTLNNAQITVAGVVIPKWQGKINSITADPNYTETGTKYWIAHYEIEVVVQTPLYQLFLDAGMKELNPGQKNKMIENIVMPAPLDGAGHALSEPQKAAGTNFHFWHFYDCIDSAWSGLSLPTSNS